MPLYTFCEDSLPYDLINSLPFDGSGFFINQKPLDELLKSRPFYKAVEIGSWLGMSTRFIAQRLAPEGKLYAIDTWKGTSGETWHEQDARLSYLYQLFLSNVKHEQLTDIIIPVRMESLEAAMALNIKADLIYIDAAHDTKSVFNDIIAWYPHLEPDGIMCGDDWEWETVKIAVTSAAQILGKQVYSEGYFWRYY